MHNLTPVVKHLLIINVLMYIGTLWMGSPDYLSDIKDLSDWGRFSLAAFYPTSEFSRPYQFITYMFMHADVGHLFFNMFAIYMFGPPVEMALGPKRFLNFYFVTGFGALGLHFIVKYFEIQYSMAGAAVIDIPTLGASGSVFGVLVGFGMLFPDHKVMLLIPPIPMKARTMVILYAAMELFLGLGPFKSGIAHFAHLGGAFAGFLMLVYWQGWPKR